MVRLAFVLLMLAALPANAADILVLSPGTMGAGLKALAASWGAQTGNTVRFKTGTGGAIKADAGGDLPADLVILPTSELRDIAAKTGPITPVAHAPFGLIVKAGQPHPDISTLEKFIAVLKNSEGLTYGDPSGGSFSGARVATMLARPDFAAVKALPRQGAPARYVAKGEALYGGGVISEEIPVPGIEVVGRFPQALNIDIDYSGAVLTRAGAPHEAASFLRYIARPEAAAVWKTTGIDAP